MSTLFSAAILRTRGEDFVRRRSSSEATFSVRGVGVRESEAEGRESEVGGRESEIGAGAGAGLGAAAGAAGGGLGGRLPTSDSRLPLAAASSPPAMRATTELTATVWPSFT